jgi:hypothetical protein
MSSMDNKIPKNESYIISEGFDLEEIDLESLTFDESLENKKQQQEIKSVTDKIKTDLKKLSIMNEDEIKARIHFEYYVDPIVIESLIKINEVKKLGKTVFVYLEGEVSNTLQTLKHISSIMNSSNNLRDIDFVDQKSKQFKKDFSQFNLMIVSYELSDSYLKLHLKTC